MPVNSAIATNDLIFPVVKPICFVTTKPSTGSEIDTEIGAVPIREYLSPAAFTAILFVATMFGNVKVPTVVCGEVWFNFKYQDKF